MTRSFDITLKTTEQNLIVAYALVYLKPKQLMIKDCARSNCTVKTNTDRQEASRGLSATAELLVSTVKAFSIPETVNTLFLLAPSSSADNFLLILISIGYESKIAVK